MAKPRNSQIAKRKSATRALKFEVVVKKLQKSRLHLSHKPSSSLNKVPKDVKEGHFAEIEVVDNEERKFIIPLSYYTHPTFLRLLKQAAAEYGFDHEGALTIPCQPGELERMLTEQRANKGKRGSPVLRVGWDSYTTNVVENC